MDIHEKPIPTDDIIETLGRYEEIYFNEPVYGFDPDCDPMPAGVDEAPEHPAEPDEDIPF